MAAQRARWAAPALVLALLLASYMQCTQAQPKPQARPANTTRRGSLNLPGRVPALRGSINAAAQRSDSNWYFRSKPRGEVEVCNTPKACTTVPRFPVEKYAQYECQLWLKGTCQFKSMITKWPAAMSADRRPSLPRVNEIAIASYNKILSSQNIMPLYQHTSDHAVLEAAKQLLMAGATSFKFDLKNMLRNGKVAGVSLISVILGATAGHPGCISRTLFQATVNRRSTPHDHQQRPEDAACMSCWHD